MLQNEGKNIFENFLLMVYSSLKCFQLVVAKDSNLLLCSSVGPKPFNLNASQVPNLLNELQIRPQTF